MSESKQKTGKNPEEPPEKGTNLALLYGVLVLALAAAIGFALLIVAPFYHRR
ncbi:MAG: hypothetical protein WAN35_11985 [Terracidiphilus sp.]